jgi:hypothetical protein
MQQLHRKIVPQHKNSSVNIGEQFFCVYYCISFFYVESILPNRDQNCYVKTCIFY